MASRTRRHFSRGSALWNEIIEEGDENQGSGGSLGTEIAVVYQRKYGDVAPRKNESRRRFTPNGGYESRPSLLPVRRDSWNRSLSTRGRTSISAIACVVQLKPRKPRRNAKPPLPKGKANFDKERAYFEEIDAFELLIESPSPKRPTTWVTTAKVDDLGVPLLSSVLKKWLISHKLSRAFIFPGSLSKISETPVLPKDPNGCIHVPPSTSKTLGKDHLGVCWSSNSTSKTVNSNLQDRQLFEVPNHDTCEDIDVSLHDISLMSTSADGQGWSPFSALLTACGQSVPSTLKDVLQTYSNKESIAKIGEGTYGEAFKVGNNVCKIVPFDGDLRITGELQKKSEEMLEEVVLSCTLNHLRGHNSERSNACSAFIKTIDLKVCQGYYDPALVSAWEEWDEKHGSENYHPKVFPQKQCYIVFVQEHGGKDLENFVLLNFEEARSLITQVTLALAVAEAAYEFEHRDLHWGNILLTREDSTHVQFILEGKKLHVQNFGLLVTLIDFTLSRINTGEDIHFLDLSSDPELFEGPRGDKQADTYRKMRDTTGECWEGSFLKTNVLWLQYLVDILLLKKSYVRTSKDERVLRSLKKRLDSYGSAKEAASDPFFTDLFTYE